MLNTNSGMFGGLKVSTGELDPLLSQLWINFRFWKFEATCSRLAIEHGALVRHSTKLYEEQEPTKTE